MTGRRRRPGRLHALALWACLGPLLLPALVRATPPDADKPVVHFGVIPRYNPLVMLHTYQPIMDYLTEVTPYRFELRLTRSYEQAVDLLQDEEVEVASLGDVTFFEAYRKFGALLLVRPLNAAGEPFYRSIVIVRKTSDIKTLDQLKGRTFGFGSLHSTSGNLIPRLFLFRNGIRLGDLKSYRNLGKHDLVAKAVLKGEVDAGAVKDVVAYRYRQHGLRFLAESEPIPTVPVVAHPHTPEAVRRALTEALLAVDPSDPALKERLAAWDPEFRNGFIPAQLEDYRAIFEQMNSISDTCGEGCHR